MSKSSLSYALSREIDDFCRGSAPDGTEFWVSVVSEPTINEKHMTEVNVRLAQETPEGLEPLGRFTIKAWPSVLDEFDRELMKHATERPDWIFVVYECFQGNRSYVRRMKVHDTRNGTLTTTSQPKEEWDGPNMERLVQPEQAGPPKPAADLSQHHASRDSSERGQPRAGGSAQAAVDAAGIDEPVLLVVKPPAACSHEHIRIHEHPVDGKGFYCKDCGERVG